MSALRPRDESLNQCVARLQGRLALKLKALQRQATPANVHEARSAARRLHAILAICKRHVSPGSSRTYLRALKRVTKKLGQLRDLDVARLSIDKLAPVGRQHSSDERGSLKRALNTERQRIASAMRSEWFLSPEVTQLNFPTFAH